MKAGMKACDYKIGTHLLHEGEAWEVEGFRGDNELFVKRLTDDGTHFIRTVVVLESESNGRQKRERNTVI